MNNKEDIIEAILFAESEGDWDEVEKLYRMLFKLNDMASSDSSNRAVSDINHDSNSFIRTGGC